jgi:parallel beta-helix repeat protein
MIIRTTALILALITVFTTTAAAISCDCGDICVNETGWWNDGGSFNASTAPIQAAVNAASGGETICVKAGSYTENVDVGKRLTIRSENGSVNTIVNAASSSDHVFDVTADYVNISGFTVKRATDRGKAGIYLYNRQHCNISENKAYGNYYGIYLSSSSNNTLFNNSASNNYYGIALSSSSNNNLTGNTVNSNNNNGGGIAVEDSSKYNTLTSNTVNSNDWYGIALSSSSNNNLTVNTVNSNDWYGIALSSSSKNTLAGNTMLGNMYNFGVYGSSLSEYTQNIDTSNTVDGKPIYYWVDQKDRQIPCNAGFVGVVNGTNITVRDLTLTNNIQGALFAYTENSRIENVTANLNVNDGIYLSSSSNNTLFNNTASNNLCGIGLSSSSNNALTNNTVNSNEEPGIYLDSSSNNTLTDNDVSNNGGGIWLEDSSNNNLTSNTASNNGGGIGLSSSSNNNITCNWVHDNWNGFYLTGGSTDNNISYNNIIIAGGYEYQFRNDQSDDVNATNNWWGTTDNDIINASIFDGQDDPDKGIVTYLPKLGSPSPCAPIPELPTVLLLAVGLLALVGCARIGRRA